MLITSKVLVRNSNFYKKLGYPDDKEILIDIKDLSIGSNVIVEAKCDYCDNNKSISYKEYNKRISINNKFTCSIKCGRKRLKEINLEKYGVESINSLSTTKKKVKSTFLKKYGVEHVSQIDSVRKSKSVKMNNISEETSKRASEYWNNLCENDIDQINNKRKNTCLDRYGVDNINKLDNIKNKIKETVNDRYGGFTYQVDVLKDKVKNTNMDKYGVDIPSTLDEIKNKVKKTNLEKYGVDSPMKLPEFKNKMSKVILEKYGVDNVMKLPYFSNLIKDRLIDKYGVDSYFKTEYFKNNKLYEICKNESYRKDNFNVGKEENYIKYLGDNISLFKCDVGKDHEFEINIDNYHNRNRMKVKLCTVCFPIFKNSSINEKNLLLFIQSIYSGKIIENYRDELEIDIYLPELNIGFEFNGLYWHSDKYKDKNYHLEKMEFFEKKNIKIYNIWEDDWDNKSDIVKSQILNWLNLTSNKIFARKCQIKELYDTNLVKEFLDENHIQGYVNSNIKLGLFYKNEMVSMITFDKMEGRKKMEIDGWNLNRFCSKKNTIVIGGASKLLKFFINKYEPTRIISFADRDWSNGGLYYNLGFNFVKNLDPDYKYIVDNMRVNKQRFTKSKLSKLGFDTIKTESVIMSDMGYHKIFNCGKIKFELRLLKVI